MKATKYFKVLWHKSTKVLFPWHQYKIWDAQGKTEYSKGLKAFRFWASMAIVMIITIAFI